MNRHFKNSMFQKELIGHAPEIEQIRKSIPSLAKSDQHVAILGDPGTEKLVAAIMLYEKSNRKDDPLILSDATRLNTAYDVELWQLFKEQDPKIIKKESIKGTLVLQNLDHLNAETQNKILNIARKGYFESKEQAKVFQTDLRIIATTSPKILDAVNQGIFDSELYFSISELMIKFPRLIDRKQDIPLLFDYFLQQICKDLNRPVPAINFEIFNQMLKHNWAGNIKELENVVRSLVLSSPEDELLPEMLPFYNQKKQFNKIELQSLGLAVSQVEKELIEKALRRFAGNQSRAAKILGISEPNMRFKMKKLGINKEDYILGTES
jgi:DNA-binding NtrC family response regulator